MNPLRRHTTWADGDARFAGFVVALVCFVASLVVIERLWARWAHGRPVGMAPLVLACILTISCWGFSGLVGPFMLLQLLGF